MIPDLAAVLAEFYLTDDAVGGMVEAVDDQVHIGRIGQARSWPLLLITVLPQNSVTTARVDRNVEGLIQLEGFGVSADDSAGAFHVCALAHARARRGLPVFDHDEVTVTAVRPDTGPQQLPLDDHQRARYAATVRITAFRRADAAA